VQKHLCDGGSACSAGAVLLRLLEQDGILIQLHLQLALLLLTQVSHVDPNPPLEWGRDGLLSINGFFEDLTWGLVLMAIHSYNRLNHIDKIAHTFGQLGCRLPSLLIPLLIQSGLVNLWCHEHLLPGSSSVGSPSYLLGCFSLDLDVLVKTSSTSVPG